MRAAMFETNDERELLARAVAWPDAGVLDELTAGRLREIAAAEGIDFATALLYTQILSSPRHGPWIEQIDSIVPPSGQQRLRATLVIVPGGFYKEARHADAEGRVLREVAARLGCRAEVVPLESFGSLTRNARILSDWLVDRRNEPLILASLSKAGAEVKLALDRPDAGHVFRNVHWWLNFSGIVGGTALSAWLLARRLRTLGCRLLCWWRGYDFGAVAEMASGPGSLLDFELRLPPHLRAIHIFGFPLSHHVTPGPMLRGCRRVRHLGPTDGAGVLLAKVAGLPGFVYPVWGADHYLRPYGKDGHDIAMRLLTYVGQQEGWFEADAESQNSLTLSKELDYETLGHNRRDRNLVGGRAGAE